MIAKRCRACPQEHAIYLQAEPDWYRPTLAEQVQQVAGCLAHMVALVIASLVIWGLLIALFLGAA